MSHYDRQLQEAADAAFAAAHPSIAMQIEQEDNIRKYKQQTEMFWLLQLQFMQMDIDDLLSTYIAVKSLAMYVPNSKTEKINEILNNYARIVHSGASRTVFDEEIPCIATHLALQLAGVEE